MEGTEETHTRRTTHEGNIHMERTYTWRYICEGDIHTHGGDIHTEGTDTWRGHIHGGDIRVKGTYAHTTQTYVEVV